MPEEHKFKKGDIVRAKRNDGQLPLSPIRGVVIGYKRDSSFLGILGESEFGDYTAKEEDCDIIYDLNVFDWLREQKIIT